MAQRAEVIVYTISTNISRRHAVAETKFWNALPTPPADAPSFLFNSTTWPTPSSKSRMNCAASTRFPTSPPTLRNDGRYHTIEILAQNHKGLRVRSRRGYFAPTQ